MDVNICSNHNRHTFEFWTNSTTLELLSDIRKLCSLLGSPTCKMISIHTHYLFIFKCRLKGLPIEYSDNLLPAHIILAIDMTSADAFLHWLLWFDFPLYYQTKLYQNKQVCCSILRQVILLL